MLNKNNLPTYFQAEAVNTACYIVNRVFVAKKMSKTPYELWKDRVPNIGYFIFFGCKCFISNTKDKLGKFDAKADICIFLGYSNFSIAYRVFHKKLQVQKNLSMLVLMNLTHLMKRKVVILMMQIRRSHLRNLPFNRIGKNPEKKQRLRRFTRRVIKNFKRNLWNLKSQVMNPYPKNEGIIQIALKILSLVILLKECLLELYLATFVTTFLLFLKLSQRILRKPNMMILGLQLCKKN